jgi:hypothetical protein
MYRVRVEHSFGQQLTQKASNSVELKEAENYQKRLRIIRRGSKLSQSHCSTA